MEEDREFQHKKRQGKLVGKGFLPLVGFVLIVALGVIAAVLAQPVRQWLGQVLPNFPPAGTPLQTWNILVGGVLFVIMLMIAAFTVAMAIPRKRKGDIRVTEKQLAQERVKMVKNKKIQKKRQQEINRQMRGR